MTDEEQAPPCFYCGSDDGYHSFPEISDGRLICSNCSNNKMLESDLKDYEKYYETWKKEMDGKTRNAYEKYFIWTQRKLKS